MQLLTAVNQANQIVQGLSYWKVKLTSGDELSELDVRFDAFFQGKRIDWGTDVVQSKRCEHIAELTLGTPHGIHTMLIDSPCSAFQLKCGMMSLFGGERTIEGHIIGRVDDKHTGDCTAAIWDVREQRLLTDYHTNVHNFATWRAGIANIGAINLQAVGVELA